MTTGQRLTAFYVDVCHETGHVEMIPMKGHVARRAKELLDCGISEQKVGDAIGEFVRRRGRSALQLAEIHAELEREGGPIAERPSARRAANAWISKNGWPTGATFKRGRHGGTYVWDPLGTERLPSDYRGWPYQRPTFDDVIQAVAGVKTVEPPRVYREPNLDDDEMSLLPLAEAMAEYRKSMGA